MSSTDTVDHFESERPRLMRLAFRMLGRWSEAEDVVQDAYLRWHSQGNAARSAAAWLTTVTTRLAIDRLRRVKASRETYPGPWLPEPADVREGEPEFDLSVGLMLVLERLTPEERAAFTLREAFDTPYAEIATMLDKKETAVRQIVSRARERVRRDRPRQPLSGPIHAQMLTGFVAAMASGDITTLKSLLAQDVRMVTDGGGRRSAALRIVTSRDEVAALVHFLGGKRQIVQEARILNLNDAPSLYFVNGDGDPVTLQIEVHEEGISALYVMRNPEKLNHLRVA